MAEISREELDRLYHTIDAGFSGVHSRLDTMNSRVGKAEIAIGVLQDRGDRATDPAARWTSGIAGVLVVVTEVLHRVWGAK